MRHIFLLEKPPKLSNFAKHLDAKTLLVVAGHHHVDGASILGQESGLEKTFVADPLAAGTCLRASWAFGRQPGGSTCSSEPSESNGGIHRAANLPGLNGAMVQNCWVTFRHEHS